MHPTTAHSLAVFCGPTLLLMTGILPAGRPAPGRMRLMRIPLVSVVVSLAMALLSTLMLVTNGKLDSQLVSTSWPIQLSVGTYFDSLTATMLLLVTFIGVVIVRFSERYLDGDANQPRFMRLICLTLGSVSLLIISGNVFMFAVAWLMTSLSLHSLLIYYPERPAAILTARKKFAISRLGDLMLVIAIVICYNLFGSFEYGVIFQQAEEMAASEKISINSTLLSLAGIFFVIGAMTKSAQFPFHSWLPDTMETPTPVSALMHAGIINAGGFLVIRLSPLVTNSHLAMDLLAAIGGLTALLGVICMLPQTSVKRALAYSTMAQMGFMMLQCGVGAFSAALLHIVAHSLYKANAFLSSGSVLETRSGLVPRARISSHPVSLLLLSLAFVCSASMIGAAYYSFGLFSADKPGSWILSFILILAITQLLWGGFGSRIWSVAMRTFAASVAVTILYVISYIGFDAILAVSVSSVQTTLSVMDVMMMALVAVGFCAVFLLQVCLTEYRTTRFMTALYVASANGFYLDIFVHRIVNFIYRRPFPSAFKSIL